MEGDQAMRRGNSGYEEMKSPEYEKAGDHFGYEGVEFPK